MSTDTNPPSAAVYPTKPSGSSGAVTGCELEEPRLPCPVLPAGAFTGFRGSGLWLQNHGKEGMDGTL